MCLPLPAPSKVEGPLDPLMHDSRAKGQGRRERNPAGLWMVDQTNDAKQKYSRREVTSPTIRRETARRALTTMAKNRNDAAAIIPLANWRHQQISACELNHLPAY